MPLHVIQNITLRQGWISKKNSTVFINETIKHPRCSTNKCVCRNRVHSFLRNLETQLLWQPRRGYEQAVMQLVLSSCDRAEAERDPELLNRYAKEPG